MTLYLLSFAIVIVVFGLALVRVRNMDRWLPSYVKTLPKRRPRRAKESVHILLCIADHYEPRTGNASPEVANARVERWISDYPRLFGTIRDSDGRSPRHSFFFPQEEYDAQHVTALTELCRAGHGEVEIHLHHEGDTSQQLRRKLLEFKQILHDRHGLLSRHRATGEIKYGFIHGNWALDNSHAKGLWCGVNDELDVLRETGCYADFTLPSAPNAAQTRKINSIYYAVDDPLRPKSHDGGTDVGRGYMPDKSLLLVQGPLILDWKHRKWGLIPRIENACLQGSQHATFERMQLWMRARVGVPTRQDWIFVKLHTHGAPEWNHSAVLGEPMVRFHQELARAAAEDSSFHFHYVTAREMYNLVKAAEAGWRGSVAEALDFELVRVNP